MFTKQDEVTVRALLDGGNQKSYISPQTLARCLKLEETFHISLSVFKFGSDKLKTIPTATVGEQKFVRKDLFSNEAEL